VPRFRPSPLSIPWLRMPAAACSSHSSPALAPPALSSSTLPAPPCAASLLLLTPDGHACSLTLNLIPAPLATPL
jgi:hypothetical protein